MNDITVPDTTGIDQKAMDLLSKAQAMTVNTAQEYAVMDRFCVNLSEMEKEIKSTFKDPKEKAFAAHRSIVAAETKHLEPVQQARRVLKAKMMTFQEAEEAKRRAEEKRLEDEALKKAEDDALAQAAEAEKNGDTAQAQAIIASPVAVAPVVLANTTPKAQTAIRQAWTSRIDKPVSELSNAELLAVRAFLTWDPVKLNAQARATHDAVKVAGVTFYSRPV